ncbi:topology modulation protein [Streptomonospora litoralis]|uniref:Topology modulation protein n=2 Tax=Streptomonospora litoralis TaxID=2498135 RepID=A0A4P6Q9M2_9ACTN|nr:topology modulation protein [Streptomonospora litoralis]
MQTLPGAHASLPWWAMKKVAIVGCGGSGKSHLARALGQVLDAPATHLDAAFYDDEWNALPMDEFAQLQRELVSQPLWVIDGNYNSTLQIRLEACDTVVLMDVSTIAALYGIFSRQLRHGAGHKGNGVHNRVHWGVLTYVATYRRRMRPRVMAKIEEFAADRADVVLLTNRRQTRRWLREVAAEQA